MIKEILIAVGVSALVLFPLYFFMEIHLNTFSETSAYGGSIKGVTLQTRTLAFARRQ